MAMKQDGHGAQRHDPWNLPPRRDSWPADADDLGAPRPAVVLWFKVYAFLMACLYVLVALVGLAVLLMPETSRSTASVTETLIMGWAFLLCGVPLALAFFLAIFLRRGKGVWIYDLVLIALGLTSPCCLPAGVPLLIFWIRPDCRVWFERVDPKE